MFRIKVFPAGSIIGLVIATVCQVSREIWSGRIRLSTGGLLFKEKKGNWGLSQGNTLSNNLSPLDVSLSTYSFQTKSQQNVTNRDIYWTASLLWSNLKHFYFININTVSIRSLYKDQGEQRINRGTVRRKNNLLKSVDYRVVLILHFYLHFKVKIKCPHILDCTPACLSINTAQYLKMYEHISWNVVYK